MKIKPYKTKPKGEYDNIIPEKLAKQKQVTSYITTKITLFMTGPLPIFARQINLLSKR